MSPRASSAVARVLLLAALGSPSPVPAQEDNGSGLDPVEKLSSTIRGELPRDQLTVLGILVGRDSLAVVEHRLGPAHRFTPGASTEMVAVCYEPQDAQRDDTVVIFEADASDPKAVVLMAHITKRGSLGGMARHCQPSAALADGVGNEAGLRLGLSQDDFIARFVQAPSENHARYAGFYFYQPIEPRADVGPWAECQLLSGVRIRVRLGRTLAVTVYHFYRGSGC